MTRKPGSRSRRGRRPFGARTRRAGSTTLNPDPRLASAEPIGCPAHLFIYMSYSARLRFSDSCVSEPRSEQIQGPSLFSCNSPISKLIDPPPRALTAVGYDVPTPIQRQAIPHVLNGRDLLGCAQTGTGKTAAFALPMLQRLATEALPANRPRPIRALVLTPTRDLAAQIGESFATYGRNLRLTHAVIFGGVGQLAQERNIASRPDILVATPGRLLDLCGQRIVSLAELRVFVLDEADRMLDMGFIHDVRKIIRLIPERRQTLFFSATMPPDIQELSQHILVDPARVAVTPVASTADRIEQRVYFVDKPDKRALLEHLLRDPEVRRALVFTRTKHGANRVAEQLNRASIGADAIHGNKSQNARERALASFKSGAYACSSQPTSPHVASTSTESPTSLTLISGGTGKLRSSHRPYRACRRGRRSVLVLRWR